MASVTERDGFSDANSTETALASDATFTGEWVDGSAYDSLTVAVSTDADGTVQVQFSVNASDVDSTVSYAIFAAAPEAPHRLTILRRYYRVRYVNGSTAQSFMRLQTLYGDKTMVSSPLNAVIGRSADAIVTRPVETKITAALGLFRGIVHDTKYGFNADVDAAEDIILAGGDYAGHPQTDGSSLGVEENFQLVCASANDTAAGTGAQQVTFNYLDDDGIRQTAVIETNGGNVDTGISGIRSARGFVSRTGSGGVNAGLITLRHITTTANIFWTIGAGANRTQYCVETVPSDSVCFLENPMITPDRSGSVVAKGAYFVRREGNQGYTPLFTIQSVGDSNPEPNPGITTLGPLTDIKLRVSEVSAGNTEVNGQFDFWFLKT
jgi:hypothetical protein